MTNESIIKRNNINNIINSSYSIDDIHRMDNNDNNSPRNTSLNKYGDKIDYSIISEINVNIYRYKFTDEFIEELYKFSKIHQYDSRADFKEAWNLWIENNEELVNNEVRRHVNLGYNGDVLDKMFKSARYYFRKKSTEKKDPKSRRVYVGTEKVLLNSIDEHIKNNINDKEFKPSDGFTHFCTQNTDLLKEEIKRLVKIGITDSTEIRNKFKKTYKNRYFILTKNNK